MTKRPTYSVEPDDASKFTTTHDTYYTAFAGLYDRAVRHLPVWKTWLAQALPHIQGPRVLEVSFGTGYLMSRYADRFEVHGADFNRRMIEVARHQLGRSRAGANLICANVEALPYADESFDSIVNTMAFSGYPDGMKALTEMRRVLRPTGCLVLIDFCYPADGNRWGTWSADVWKVSGDLIRDMGDLFRRCGFEFTEEEIGGWGSVHLYIAKPQPVA